jgi:sugar lactone lactonase YvrE
MITRVAADFPCPCGEGPLWHPEQELLYWFDVENGNMYIYDPGERRAVRVYQGETIGGATLQADGQLLLLMNRGALGLWEPEQGLRLQRQTTPGAEHTRFNDAIADPEGRVFSGTMPSEQQPGRLYRLDPDGTIQVVIEELGQPNGMAFSPDGSFFYLTDTRARNIQRFRYDRNTGQLSDASILIEIPEGQGQPDGLTVDSLGNLWSAQWDGSSIRRYDPQGKLLEIIAMPARHITSLAFVGNLLYVTSAGGAERPETGDQAGALFELETELTAPPEFRSCVSF